MVAALASHVNVCRASDAMPGCGPDRQCIRTGMDRGGRHFVASLAESALPFCL